MGSAKITSGGSACEGPVAVIWWLRGGYAVVTRTSKRLSPVRVVTPSSIWPRALAAATTHLKTDEK